MSSRSETFTEALATMDSGKDTTSLVELFASDAELLRPELQADGSRDATKFWDTYQAQVGDITTTFTRTQEDGDLGVLEWMSTGSLAAGRPVDTAAFLVPGPDHG